jgi:hypothetical protein
MPFARPGRDISLFWSKITFTNKGCTPCAISKLKSHCHSNIEKVYENKAKVELECVEKRRGGEKCSIVRNGGKSREQGMQHFHIFCVWRQKCSTWTAAHDYISLFSNVCSVSH